MERELQEKAHAQMMLNTENTDQIRATEMFEDMVHLSLNNVAAAAAAAASSTSVAAAAGTPAAPVAQPPTTLASSTGSSVRNVTNLANLPPSERPKAKPSRKIVNNQQNIANNAGAADKSKKCQLQECQQTAVFVNKLVL